MGQRGDGGEEQHAREVADDALHGPAPGQGDVGLVERGGGDQGPVGAADAEGQGGVAGQRAAEGGADGDRGERAEPLPQGRGPGGEFGVRAEEFVGLGRGLAGAGDPAAAAQRVGPGAQPLGVAVGRCGQCDLGTDDEAFQRVPGGGAGARGGQGQQRLPGGLYGGVPGGAQGGVAVAGAAGGGVRGCGVQCLGGGPAFRAVRADQGGCHSDEPGPHARGGGQGQVPGDLGEGLRDEEGGGADEGEDHVARRADAGGVAQHLLHGGQQGAHGDEDDGVAGERGGDQGDGDAAEHAEHHPGQRAGAGGVGTVVGVQRAQRPGHRVHRQVEPAERQQEQVGRGYGGDRTQGGFEPDLGGTAQAQHARQGQTSDR